MRITQSLLSLLCFCLFIIGCSSDGDDPTPPPSSADYQIRLLYQEEFVLVNYPLDLLSRSTCGAFRSVETDEDGVFELDDFSPEDLLMVAEIEGQNIISIIPAAAFRTGTITDVAIANPALININGLDNEIVIEDLGDDGVDISFQIVYPNYPLEKMEVQIISYVENIEIKTTADANGQVNVKLPINRTGLYNFEVNLIDYFDTPVFGGQVFFNLDVRQALDLRFGTFHNQCNDLLLNWDPYTGDDFFEYQITYNTQYSGAPGCENVDGFISINEQDQSQYSVTDYSSADEICFTLSVVTQSGVSTPQVITVDQPYTTMIESGDPVDVKFTSLADYYYFYQEITNLDLKVCEITDDQVGSCLTITDYQSSMVNNVYKDEQLTIAQIKSDGVMDIYQGLSYASSITLREWSSVAQVISKDHAVVYESIDSHGFRLYDLNSQEAVNRYALSRDFWAQRIFPTVDGFAALVQNQSSFEDFIYTYEVNTNGQMSQTGIIPLNPGMAFQEFYQSPNMRYIVGSEGAIIDLLENTIREHTMGNRRIQARHVNDQNILIIDYEKGEVELVDIRIGAIRDTQELCFDEVIAIAPASQSLRSKQFNDTRGLIIR